MGRRLGSVQMCLALLVSSPFFFKDGGGFCLYPRCKLICIAITYRYSSGDLPTLSSIFFLNFLHALFPISDVYVQCPPRLSIRQDHLTCQARGTVTWSVCPDAKSRRSWSNVKSIIRRTHLCYPSGWLLTLFGPVRVNFPRHPDCDVDPADSVPYNNDVFLWRIVRFCCLGRKEPLNG